MMARPKLGEGETQRLQIKISDEEMGSIEDWRYANRVPSRSEAVRRLCQIGIVCTGPTTAAAEALLDISATANKLINDVNTDYRDAESISDAARTEALRPYLRALLDLYDKIELAQVLTADIGNQVAHIASASTFNDGVEGARSTKQAALKHLEFLRDEQQKRKAR